MQQTAMMVLLSISCILLVIFMVRIPKKMMSVIGSGIIRMMIAVLFLFFFNILMANFGWHIPINIFTVLTTGIFGIFGIGTLVAMQFFLL